MDKLEKLKELADFLEVDLEDLKPSVDELIKLIKPLIPAPIKGENGEDGERGKDGKDYVLTRQDKKDIASEIKVPVVEKLVERIETIKPEIKEVAKYETPEEVAEKLNTLEEVIDWTVIKGLKERFKKLEENRVFGGVVSRTAKVNGETYVATNGQTDFTLLYPPINDTLRVFRGGARQSVSNYTVSGSIISFTVSFQAGEEATFDYER